MAGWRVKFIFLLVVYFAGFATAIYCLAPAPENPAGSGNEKGMVFASLKSDEFAKTFNEAMHKFITVGKSAAMKTGDYLKDKYEQMQQADTSK